MVILVCGSRTWTSADQTLRLARRLAELRPTQIIAGGAVGADQIAENWAKRNSIPVLVCTPNWNKFGRSAGIKRNNQMLDMKPDLVLACWDGQSKGTKHTIDEAERRGIRVEVLR